MSPVDLPAAASAKRLVDPGTALDELEQCWAWLASGDAVLARRLADHTGDEVVIPPLVRAR